MISNLWITGNGLKVPFGLNEQVQYTRSAASTGGGGWQMVDRPRKKVSTEWVDCGPYQLTMNLIMDSLMGPNTPAAIEHTIGIVEAWEEPAAGSAPPEPPKLHVQGPVPHNEVQWIVYTLNWGDCIRSTTTGERQYQELQVVLWEYSPPTLAVLAASPAKAAQAAQTGRPVTTYTVKAGDTLTAIAARLLGSYTKWTEIATLNNIRDPNTIRPGQVLHIPAS